MGNFGLVTCAREEAHKEIWPKWLRLLLEFMHKWRKARRMEIEVHKIKLYEELDVYILKLPFTLEEYGSLKNNTLGKITAKIKKNCTEQDLKSCILPKILLNANNMGRYTDYEFDGQILFKSILLNVLDALYVQRGIGLAELETTILQGESLEELLSLLRLLAPLMKYITVITSDKSVVEQEAEVLYEETGLSLRVTDEYKSALKNAQLVINLSSLKEEIKFRMHPKAMIVNLSNDCISKKVGDNKLINGVEVKLPLKLFKLLDREIFKYFSCTQLSEIILMQKLGIEPAVGGSYDYLASEELSREFKKEGYGITGFIGRRNVYRISDLKVDTNRLNA